MPLPRSSYLLIDLLKIVAAQCIVWHHLAAYGPLSDAAAQAAPELMGWLYEDARMAVQIFLVVAGYLAARSLGQGSLQSQGLLATLGQRYQRLVLPFLAALLITMLCSAWVRPYLDRDLVPDTPSLGQWLAHASLLHSLLAVESLSAGAWYVAIDFQLYALLAALVWLSRGHCRVSAALTAALAAASLAWFNLDAEFDIWAIYFFGAYGLGALAWWARPQAHNSRYAQFLYLGTLLVGMGSLMLAFRERVALAMLVSSILVVFGSSQLPLPSRVSAVVQQLGNRSYALFLLHFPVLLLANALWAELGLHDGTGALVCLGAAWAVSLWASFVFFTQVEQRLGQWLTGPRAVAAASGKL